MTSVLMMRCYGRYNSFRVARVGMQTLTELFQFVFRVLHPFAFIRLTVHA